MRTHCCWATRAPRPLPVSRGGRATGARARSTSCSSPAASGGARLCSCRGRGSTSSSTVAPCGGCGNGSSSCSTCRKANGISVNGRRARVRYLPLGQRRQYPCQRRGTGQARAAAHDVASRRAHVVVTSSPVVDAISADRTKRSSAQRTRSSGTCTRESRGEITAGNVLDGRRCGLLPHGRYCAVIWISELNHVHSR